MRNFYFPTKTWKKKIWKTKCTFSKKEWTFRVLSWHRNSHGSCTEFSLLFKNEFAPHPPTHPPTLTGVCRSPKMRWRERESVYVCMQVYTSLVCFEWNGGWGKRVCAAIATTTTAYAFELDVSRNTLFLYGSVFLPL